MRTGFYAAADARRIPSSAALSDVDCIAEVLPGLAPDAGSLAPADYIDGACGTFALALAESFGAGILAAWSAHGDGSRRTLVHAFAVLDAGGGEALLDVRGACDDIALAMEPFAGPTGDGPGRFGEIGFERYRPEDVRAHLEEIGRSDPATRSGIDRAKELARLYRDGTWCQAKGTRTR